MKDHRETNINEEGIKEDHRWSVKYLNGTAMNRVDFEVTHKWQQIITIYIVRSMVDHTATTNTDRKKKMEWRGDSTSAGDGLEDETKCPLIDQLNHHMMRIFCHTN
jgi:hypothetical protein